MSAEDLPEPFARLSEGQRECLRLVLGHMNSKEIGRELDISPHTVDQRLRGALRILSANSRFEAARKFAEVDTENSYQSLIYQTPHVEKSGEGVTLNSSAKRDGSFEDPLVKDASKVDGNIAAISLDGSETKQNRLPFPQYRGEKNELSTVERLGWVLVIAIGSALSFGGLLAGLEALSRLRG